MSASSERVKSWRKATKLRMVAAMGGKCQCCGYDRCVESLDLHHINPTEKEISLGAIRANPKAWGAIVNELRKCILVCRNCHGEIHHAGRLLPETYARFDERYAEYKSHPELSDPCPHCGTPKANYLRYCSASCGTSAQHASAPVDWSPFNLEELIKIHDAGEIAEMVGVSRSAVIARIRRAGGIIPRKSQKIDRDFVPYVKPDKPIPLKIPKEKSSFDNRKVEWPTKEALEKLIWEKPLTHIGQIYGVTDNTVRKWADKYGIERPPQGYWLRRECGYSHEEALVSQKRPSNPKPKITREIAEKAFALVQNGYSYRKAAAEFGFRHWGMQQAFERYGLEQIKRKAMPTGDAPV